jgi:hypothetical protein
VSTWCSPPARVAGKGPFGLDDLFHLLVRFYQRVVTFPD